MESKVLVIGGANIDYVGKSFNKLINEDSNPGIITWSFGGVARNIVENLAYLATNPTFVTAISTHDLGKEMINHLEKIGVKLLMPDLPRESSTNSYLAILDETGEMKVGLADARLISYIDCEYLKSLDAFMESFTDIVFDTNLTESTIEYLCHKYHHKHLIVDGISSSKVVKLRPFLDKIYLIKCNYLEACQLSKQTTIENMMQFYKNSGLQKIIITHGGDDLWYLDQGRFDKIIIPPVDEIKNVTGAGDALLAGVVKCLVENKPFIEAINFGIKVSQLTLKSEKTVNSAIVNLLKID